MASSTCSKLQATKDRAIQHKEALVPVYFNQGPTCAKQTHVVRAPDSSILTIPATPWRAPLAANCRQLKIEQYNTRKPLSQFISTKGQPAPSKPMWFVPSEFPILTVPAIPTRAALAGKGRQTKGNTAQEALVPIALNQGPSCASKGQCHVTYTWLPTFLQPTSILKAHPMCLHS